MNFSALDVPPIRLSSSSYFKRAYRPITMSKIPRKINTNTVFVSTNNSSLVFHNECILADLSLARQGREDIILAEHDMPGLMECRKMYSPLLILKGARISGSLHPTIQTAVLIETLKELGAEVQWCSCNILSTQNEAVAALAEKKSCKIFAWKGQSAQDYWNCIMEALVWPNNQGPNLLIDDGGDMTSILHVGHYYEKYFEKHKKLPSICSDWDENERIVHNIIVKGFESKNDFWKTISSDIIGVSEETTTGILRLEKLVSKKELLFPAINVNDGVTKTKFDNIYGCRHSLPDSIIRATDVYIAGKHVVICGYGDVGKGCAAAMKNQGAIVYVTEIDPICALQACMEGFQVVELESVLSKADIYVTATGNIGIIDENHIMNMKNNAILCNIGHFNNEIAVEKLSGVEGVNICRIKPNVDKYTFPNGKSVIILAEGRLVNLACGTGHPSLVMSCSFTNQVLAQIALWTNPHIYNKNKLYKLSKHHDETVARLHLPAFNAKLTVLKDYQSEYSNIPKEGPYKNKSYRY